MSQGCVLGQLLNAGKARGPHLPGTGEGGGASNCPGPAHNLSTPPPTYGQGSPSGGWRGRNPLPALLQLPLRLSHSASTAASPPTPTLLPTLIRTFVGSLGPVGNPGSASFRVLNLIPSARSLLPWDVTDVQILGIRTWTSRGCYSAPTQGERRLQLHWCVCSLKRSKCIRKIYERHCEFYFKRKKRKQNSQTLWESCAKGMQAKLFRGEPADVCNCETRPTQFGAMEGPPQLERWEGRQNANGRIHVSVGGCALQNYLNLAICSEVFKIKCWWGKKTIKLFPTVWGLGWRSSGGGRRFPRCP